MKKYGSLHVCAINGSSRSNKMTRKVLEVVLRDAKKLGATTDMINLCEERLGPCDGTEDPGLADDFSQIYKRLKRANGIIFGTPTYWFNMSGLMKNLMDRLIVTEKHWMLEGKVAGFIATGSRQEDGAMAALSSIASIVNHLGMATFPYSMLYFRGGGSSWAKKDHRNYARWMLDMMIRMKGYSSEPPRRARGSRPRGG